MQELKRLMDLFRENKIGRRDFLIHTSALGIATTLIPSFLIGTATANQSLKPKKGGRLRIGTPQGSTTSNLDPALISTQTQALIGHQIRNMLVEIDQNGIPIPELAESWDVTPDAKQWKFKLRRGVEFHNGKTLDAQDVLFSINHHRKENSKSPAKSMLSSIKQIKSDDKYSVIVTLDAGNADFPFYVADQHLQIMPDGTTDFDKGIGTGAYTLIDYQPGVRTLTRRNKNYWKEGRAHFDEIETIVIDDPVARINAIRADQIDVADRPEYKLLANIKSIPNLRIIETTGTRHYTFPMLSNVSPYKNNYVRLALKHALDREQLLEMILSGHGKVGNDHPISPAMRYHASDSELPQRVYDPDKSRFYMKKAGVENFIFKLNASNGAFPGAVDAAVLYKERAKKAGINIEVVNVPSDGYWSSTWKKKPWCACHWVGRPTEDQIFSLVYAEGANWNDTNWNHEKFNKLLMEARRELDDSKRRGLYVEMQRIVSNEGSTVVPLFVNDVCAVSKKLKYGKIASNVNLDGRRLHERWWFDS